MKKPTIKFQAHIINSFFNPPPAVRAAQTLYNMGLRSRDMKMKYLVKVPPFIGDPIALSVINALRDIERTNKLITGR